MSDITPSPAELMRQHELAALRDERDVALAENKSLRELYENVTGNRERFGWTINHLLECEDALRAAEERAEEARAEGEAARTAEAIAVLRAAKPGPGRGLNIYNEAADVLAEHFNPEAKR